MLTVKGFALASYLVFLVGIFSFAILLVIFRYAERHGASQLIATSVILKGEVLYPLACQFLVLFLFSAPYFFAAQFLQEGLDYRPAVAGGLMLFAPAGGLIGAYFGTRAASRYQRDTIILVGVFSIGLSSIGFMIAGMLGSVGALCISFAILSFGNATCLPRLIGTIIGAVHPGLAGTASGLSETSAELGFTM